MCIKGGYILQPRAIDESRIAKSPPHVREIWLYLLRKANHKDAEIYGRTIKRGQLKTSYREIIEDLSWNVGYRKESYKKHHCEIAMKVLMREQMIEIAKTTRGIIITICNYDVYQDPKNYENDSERYNEATRERQDNDTINKNEKNEKNDNTNTEKKFNFKLALLEYGFEEKLVDEWLMVRRKKKATNSELAFKQFIGQVEKSNMEINKLLELVAVEKQWKSFNAEWLKNLNTNRNGKTEKSSSREDRERELLRLASLAYGEKK